MIRKTKLLLFTFLMQVAVLLPFVVTQPSYALFGNSQQAACQGAALNNTGGCDPAAGTKLNNTVDNVINLLSVLVGIISVIVLIINGLRMIVSNGDSQSVASARNGIIFACVGIFLVAAAQLIAHFAIAKATNQ